MVKERTIALAHMIGNNLTVDYLFGLCAKVINQAFPGGLILVLRPHAFLYISFINNQNRFIL